MILFRLVKSRERSRDLTGKGAFLYGGRWNHPGTFMLYTSETSSLAILEILVHLDESEFPPNMYLMKIEIPDSNAIFSLPQNELPRDWRKPENLSLKTMGDHFIKNNQYLAIKVPSAINPEEFNILLNPGFPNYYDRVKIVNAEPFILDQRLK